MKDQLNRHKFVSDDLIYNAVHLLNSEYCTSIDPEQFFDQTTSNFCTAELNKNVLKLVFPVVATSKYAEVLFKVDDTVLEDESIKFNKPFQLEINRSAKTVC